MSHCPLCEFDRLYEKAIRDYFKRLVELIKEANEENFKRIVILLFQFEQERYRKIVYQGIMALEEKKL